MFEYASIDCETTGLDPGAHELLEVGVVCDKFDSISGRIGRVSRIVLMRENIFCSLYCLTLHQRLFEEMQNVRDSEAWANRGGAVLWRRQEMHDLVVETAYVDMDAENGDEVLADAFMSCFCEMEDFQAGKTITVAGKNPGSLDIPFLEEAGAFAAKRSEKRVRFRHRVLDPAVLYFDPSSDEELPDLATCKKRAGLSETVAHTAVSDALDVVQLVRHKLT